MLSSVIRKDTIIKDSIAVVDELNSLKHLSPRSKMVSFDIVSLYTNIALNDTINTEGRSDATSRIRHQNVALFIPGSNE